MYENGSDKLRPPALDINTAVHITSDPNKPTATVLSVPLNESDLYTVQINNTGDIEQHSSSNLEPIAE